MNNILTELTELKKLSEKFNYSNLDRAIRKAIEEGDLFLMPRDYIFQYCRGSGPIGFSNLTPGPKDESIKDHWSSFLIARYRVQTEHEDRGEKECDVWVYIPEKFHTYTEVSQNIKHNPTLTKLEFKYSEKELKQWIKEYRKRIYDAEIKSVNKQIDGLKEYAESLTKRIKPGSAPGY